MWIDCFSIYISLLYADLEFERKKNSNCCCFFSSTSLCRETKQKIMEEEKKNSFKKMSVMPKEKDFIDAILSLSQHHRPALIVPKFEKSYRHTYVQHVRSEDDFG